MQCQYCHFKFRFAGHYGGHLRAKHSNEPVDGLVHSSLLDPLEPSVATCSKRSHSLSSAIIKTTLGIVSDPAPYMYEDVGNGEQSLQQPPKGHN